MHTGSQINSWYSGNGKAVYKGKGFTQTGSLQRKHSPDCRIGAWMQTSLKAIAQKAVNDKKHRFGNLYGVLNKDTLRSAF